MKIDKLTRTKRKGIKLIVMNDGDIVEQGTHQELLVANGFYASLYNSQFEAGVSEPGLVRADIPTSGS